MFTAGWTAGGRRRGGPAGDAGMVTAELAVAIPALVLVLAFGIAALATVSAQGRCADAAQVAARLAARGEPASVVVAAARAVAPAGAHVAVQATTAAGTAAVTVTVSAPLPLLPRILPLPDVSGAFTEAREPGAGP